MNSKLIFTFMALSFLCAGAFAQFNKTYTLEGYRVYGNSTALQNKMSDKKLVFCASVSDTPGAGINKCLLVQTDSDGVVIQAFLRDTSNGAERIIETADSGVLLVSVFMFHTQVTKFDNNLNLMWARNISHPYCFSTMWGNNWDIDIERTEENNKEMYYIVYTSGNIDYSDDINANLLKIDEMGNVLWRKQYLDVNRPNYGTTSNSALRDHVHSITSYPSAADPNRREFVISGSRDLYESNLNHTQHLFYFIVDDMGNIVQQYLDIQTGDCQPSAPDILWDGDSLVLTYIEKNCGNYDPSTASGIGFLKFDLAFTAVRGHYFWHECENYGMSLEMTSDNNYLIGGFDGLCNPSPVTFQPTALTLKLDRNNLNEIFYRRYNMDDFVMNNAFHRTSAQDANYLLTSITHPYGMWASPGEDLRVIKTDPAGRACGVRTFNMNVDDIVPEATDQEYAYEENTPVEEPMPNWQPVNLLDRTCNHNASSYKTTGVKNVDGQSGITISVLPTLVQKGDGGKINCSVHSNQETEITIAAYNILGQVSYESRHIVHSGKNSFEIETDVLAVGINFIRIMSAGNDTHVSKIMVTE